MTKLLYLLLILLPALTRQAQAQGKYLTKTGQVSFFSTSILEDIEAHNPATAAIIEVGTGQMAFTVPVKEFSFKRSLMQEHFNENYMESTKFPRATFVGHFTGVDATVLETPGSHPVQVEGMLTVHGVARKVTLQGSMELKKGQLLAFAFFNIAPADYNIDIPLLVRENIAKIVSVKVSLQCDPVGSSPAPVTRTTP